MSLQHPSSPARRRLLDPTTRCKELRLHLKQFQLDVYMLKVISNYFKKSDKEAQHEATKVDPSYSLEDEAKRMFNEVHSAMEIVKESDFYYKLIKQLDSNVFQKQLKILLGSHSTLKMVIYALGCMEFSYHSIFQLAISLLIKERCSWIDEIEVYDPDFLRADIIVLKKVGCNVLTMNENGRRSVDKPTLFFIPYGNLALIGNVFEANWCPSQINQLLVLTLSIKSGCEIPVDCEYFDDEYFNVMKKHSIEIPLPNYGNGILDGFAWHFFEMDSHLDMDILISGKVTRWETMAERKENRWLSKEERLLRRREADEGEERGHTFTYRHLLKEKEFLEPYDENTNYDEDESWDDENTNDDEKESWEDENTNDGEEEGWNDENTNDKKEESRYLVECRGPRMYKWSWHAPPKGWIKLNIASSSRKGREEELGKSMMTGYGGICYNENKERVLDYKGKINKMDQFAACVEALKIGLKEILKKFGQQKPKLIMETDNFKLVHWANWDPQQPPPSFQVQEFQQVHHLLKQYDYYIIYHVYEEANEEAILLAKQET